MWYAKLTRLLEWVENGMGYTQVVSDVTTTIEYYNNQDYLMMGFFGGSGAVNAGYVTYQNVLFFMYL